MRSPAFTIGDYRGKVVVVVARLWCGEEGGEVEIRRQTTDGEGASGLYLRRPAQTKWEEVAVVDYFCSFSLVSRKAKLDIDRPTPGPGTSPHAKLQLAPAKENTAG